MAARNGVVVYDTECTCATNWWPTREQPFCPKCRSLRPEPRELPANTARLSDYRIPELPSGSIKPYVVTPPQSSEIDSDMVIPTGVIALLVGAVLVITFIGLFIA